MAGRAYVAGFVGDSNRYTFQAPQQSLDELIASLAHYVRWVCVAEIGATGAAVRVDITKAYLLQDADPVTLEVAP